MWVWKEYEQMFDWSNTAPTVSRKCHGAAVLDGKLYVVGGSDQQMSVLSAECLDLTLPEDQVTRVDNITILIIILYTSGAGGRWPRCPPGTTATRPRCSAARSTCPWRTAATRTSATSQPGTCGRPGRGPAPPGTSILHTTYTIFHNVRIYS